MSEGLENMSGPGLTPSGPGLSAGWMEAINARGDAAVQALGNFLDKLTGVIIEKAGAVLDRGAGALLAVTERATSMMDPSHMMPSASSQRSHELTKAKTLEIPSPNENMLGQLQAPYTPSVGIAQQGQGRGIG